MSKRIWNCVFLLAFIPSLAALLDNVKGKSHPLPGHIENYGSTLTWIVKFSLLPKRIGGIEEYNVVNFDTVDHVKKEIANCRLFIINTFEHFDNVFLLGFDINLHPQFSNWFNVSINHTNHISEYLKIHDQLILAHKRSSRSVFNIEEISASTEKCLENSLRVDWYSRQFVHSRSKREQSFNPENPLNFKDAYFSQQWHLVNHVNPLMDLNITSVWERNITGKGVTVAIVDDGLEWTNQDIHNNYCKEGSWDLNDHDPDPTPSTKRENNHHGTRCAGEIAAVQNSFCAVGVAYKASISGIRVLDGPMTDSLEAEAFNKFLQINDIYSCSWGPDDDGKTVDGPHYMALRAMRYGIDFGRGGYGSIFVVASGNGGRHKDNCNFDGYANSIYTVTIGAVDETGHMPFYAEECASMLAVTFSSGTRNLRSITTTDWTQNGGNGCTLRHSGTSAAAPLAAGLIALMLHARPCLTWRDVQYIVVMTALKVDIDEAHWQRNGAGLYHSHKHGFGLMKAWRLVNAAKVWEMVPWLTSFQHGSDDLSIQITKGQHNPLVLTHTVTKEDIQGYDLYILEQVLVTMTITHPCRGQLSIVLKCPSGTRSVLATPRPRDNSSAGLDGWTFNTVRCWGESPIGTWTIIIKDLNTKFYGTGYVKKWKLKLYGTPMTPQEFRERKRKVEEAMDGRYLNDSYSLPCKKPPVTSKPDEPVSQKTLKFLAMTGVFFFLLALYETFEYAACYRDEKKEQREKMIEEYESRQTANVTSSGSNRRSRGDSEARGLMEEVDGEYLELSNLSPSSSGRTSSTSAAEYDNIDSGGHSTLHGAIQSLISDSSGRYHAIPLIVEQTDSSLYHQDSISRADNSSSSVSVDEHSPSDVR